MEGARTHKKLWKMNLPALAWEAFYKDGSVYNSKDNTWKGIPEDGVVVILIWHDYHIPGVRQKDILVGMDYYYYDNADSWGATNSFDEVAKKEFKRGAWVENATYEAIYRSAFEKLDF